MLVSFSFLPGFSDLVCSSSECFFLKTSVYVRVLSVHLTNEIKPVALVLSRIVQQHSHCFLRFRVLGWPGECFVKPGFHMIWKDLRRCATRWEAVCIGRSQTIPGTTDQCFHIRLQASEHITRSEIGSKFGTSFRLEPDLVPFWRLMYFKKLYGCYCTASLNPLLVGVTFRLLPCRRFAFSAVLCNRWTFCRKCNDSFAHRSLTFRYLHFLQHIYSRAHY